MTALPVEMPVAVQEQAIEALIAVLRDDFNNRGMLRRATMELVKNALNAAYPEGEAHYER